MTSRPQVCAPAVCLEAVESENPCTTDRNHHANMNVCSHQYVCDLTLLPLKHKKNTCCIRNDIRRGRWRSYNPPSSRAQRARFNGGYDDPNRHDQKPSRSQPSTFAVAGPSYGCCSRTPLVGGFPFVGLGGSRLPSANHLVAVRSTAEVGCKVLRIDTLPFRRP